MTARGTIDRFFSVRLGGSIADLRPGEVAVATCDRRTYAERGYGFVRLLWIMHFGDRAMVSVHPAALAGVARLAWRQTPDDVVSDDFVGEAGRLVASALPGVEVPPAAGRSIVLYHPGGAVASECVGEIRALTPSDGDRWVGDRLYMSAAEHPSAARGEAFGLFLPEGLVGEMMTHEASVSEMADLIAEDGIEVADGYRGRGNGRALLSRWTREMQAKGRACIHSTSTGNEASIGVARAVGYVEYAQKRGVAYQPPEE